MAQQQSILVTGAAGLLGRHLLPALAPYACAYAASKSGVISASGNVVPLTLDLSRPIDRSALPAKVDTVVYLAQSNRFRDFPEAANDIFQVNAAQVLGMLDYARSVGARNFVYASSGGINRTAEALLDDDGVAPTEPLGFYAASKLCGEVLAETYSPFLNVAVLRFYFIYGTGQKSGMLVPRLIDSVRNGRPVALQGADGIRINPIHAADAAKAVIAAAALDRTARINVAGPEVLSIRRMCEIIGKRVRREPVYAVQEQVPKDLIGDITRMRQLLVDPLVRFEDGVADLL